MFGKSIPRFIYCKVLIISINSQNRHRELKLLADFGSEIAWLCLGAAAEELDGDAPDVVTGGEFDTFGG